MKILFVCWANVGRSQMAASYYNHMTNSHDAESAGTEVDVPGETLGERRKRLGAAYSMDVMDEEGIDMGDNLRTQLTEELLDKYDYVISMADLKYTPKWFSDHPKYVYWEVEDPAGRGIEQTKEAREKIKKKVRQFVDSMPNV